MSPLKKKWFGKYLQIFNSKLEERIKIDLIEIAS